MEQPSSPTPEQQSSAPSEDTTGLIQNRRDAEDIAHSVEAILHGPAGDNNSEPLGDDASLRHRSRRGDEIGYVSDIMEAHHKYGRSVSPAVVRATADTLDETLDLERRASERLAMTDHLTGLANREAFDLAKASANQDPEIVFGIVDGNYFGQVNKAPGLGYSAGDALIKVAADTLRLAAETQGHVRVFRWGGDEFALLGPSKEVAAVITAAARSFDERLAQPEPLSFEHNSYPTERYREIRVSLPGVLAASFDEAAAKLKAAKDARKALDQGEVAS